MQADSNEAGNVVAHGRIESQTLLSFKGYIKKSDSGNAAGALVQLTLDGELVGDAATAASDGSFTITDVPHGVYTLHISLEGYDDAYVEVTVPTYNNLTYIIVQGKYPAGTVQDNAAIVQKQTVSGVISLEEGGYANGAAIQLYKGSALYGSTVSANVGGSYTIYDVVNGSYTIRAALAGYNTLNIKNIVVSGKNLVNKNGVIVKTYTVGSRGPAGGWIVYAGSEYDYLYYGFYYIEIAPQDISAEADGKAVFGSYMPPDEYLFNWSDSVENTKYIVNEYNKSQYGNVVEVGLAALYCVDYKLNGYNDWVMPTAEVFELIKDSGDYQNYNFKLNEQYWCSDIAHWLRTQEDGEHDMSGFQKFRFDPPLPFELSPPDYPNYFATPDGYERHYVRPVRLF
ncbi:MAG: carboxypeptidase regulatory-like domain-containing protein [Spirochaetaceae bacterium]|nr:carboxypeptidase regulatory-like domain-containing protein [Spirochaetaceae bacterium]